MDMESNVISIPMELWCGSEEWPIEENVLEEAIPEEEITFDLKFSLGLPEDSDDDESVNQG
jgi:hypothetical protein